jgi:hypothetical protein
MDDKTTGRADGPLVSPLDILLLIRSYNRREISYDEWLRLSRAWAEAMVRQYSATPAQSEAVTG